MSTDALYAFAITLIGLGVLLLGYAGWRVMARRRARDDDDPPDWLAG